MESNWKNGKSGEEREGKVSRRGVKSQCFITELPGVITKTDGTFCLLAEV